MFCRIVLAGVLMTVAAFSGVNLNLSTLNDSSSFLSDQGAKAFYVVNDTEYKIDAQYRRTASFESLRLNAGIDRDSGVVGDFYLAQYSRNSLNEHVRLGAGLSYMPVNKILEFPYLHKFSVALIGESNRGMVISGRYKFQGYWNKVGLNLVAFYTSYSNSIETKLLYTLNNNVDMFWKAYRETVDGNTIEYGTTGIELKF